MEVLLALLKRTDVAVDTAIAAAVLHDTAQQHVCQLIRWLGCNTTQVKGLEFNTFSPNLLASGAADGELCIWDVAKPAAPSMYPPLKVPLSQLTPKGG